MAYAALLSLSQTLDQIIVHDQYLHHLEKKKLVSLQGNVTTMLPFLQDYSHCNKINLFESQIIDASYRGEDIIESKLSSIYLSMYDNEAQTTLSRTGTRWGGLHKALRDIEFILKKLMNPDGTTIREESHGPNKIINLKSNFLKNLQFHSMKFCKYNSHPFSVDIPIQPLVVKIKNNVPEESECTNTMVNIGFDKDYVAIKDQMYQSSPSFKIISIVGMGGSGKSTLARRLFEDSIQMQYFDRCVWVVLSQDYSYKEVLLRVLQSITKTDDDSDLGKNTTDDLAGVIHKELFGRRYLFVLDDVWNENAWDDLNKIMPKNTDGSCVLITTRLSNIATYVTSSSQHELNLLSEVESWTLLEQSVFGTRSIPAELQIIGKKIAKECRGLPLTIVVVAGLLKGNMAKEYWESISENIGSREPTIASHCTKVLSLSYDHLPIHLKPCFLYMTAFPEDSEINANRLIRLWTAEGFIKTSGSKCLEEVAEGYLDDLVGRSILQASKRRYNGRVKTVGIHDLLRDIGSSKAQEERFHCHGHIYTKLGKQHHRRLSIHTETSLDSLQDIRNPMTHSLLMFLPGVYRLWARISNFTMLRVLDALTTMPGFNPGKVVHLRYLAFTIFRYEYGFLDSWFKLPNLQTLVINGKRPTFVPLEIWMMPSLRHLILRGGSDLERPKSEHEDVKETNLVTLYVALSLEMNIRITKMLANLKKLGIRYSGADQRDWENSQFSNIVHLEKLEELKIIIAGEWVVSGIAQVELSFPVNLKKLALHNTQLLWRDMRIVGSLPNLEVLKLKGRVSTDLEWNPIGGQFLKLKYLEFLSVPICHWEAESYHFPSLEILYLMYMGWMLEEIPSDLGEINTLRLIQLVYCKPSLVDSAMQMQADQREMGNDDLQVIVLKTD